MRTIKLILLSNILLVSHILVSMETPIKTDDLSTTPLAYMTDEIDEYADDGNLTHMATLGTWLTTHRTIITDNNEWYSTVNRIITWIPVCHCLCLENRKKMALKKVIKQIATAMQPGDNCTEELIQQVQVACDRAKQEYNESVEFPWEKIG